MTPCSHAVPVPGAVPLAPGAPCSPSASVTPRAKRHRLSWCVSGGTAPSGTRARRSGRETGVLFWHREGDEHNCFKSFLQEYVSLGRTAGRPWQGGTSFHGHENIRPSELCLGCWEHQRLRWVSPLLAQTTAKKRAPAHGGWELIPASKRERRGAEPPNWFAPTAVPLPSTSGRRELVSAFTPSAGGSQMRVLQGGVFFEGGGMRCAGICLSGSFVLHPP